jgi:hypothetical protein
MNGDGKVDDIVSVQRRYVIDQLSGCWPDPNRVCLRTRQLFEQDLLPVPQGGCHLSRLVQKDFQLVTTEVLLSEHVYASVGDKQEGSRRKMSFEPIVVVACRREVALSHLRSKTEDESIGKAQEYLASIV